MCRRGPYGLNLKLIAIRSTTKIGSLDTYAHKSARKQAVSSIVLIEIHIFEQNICILSSRR